MTRDQARQRVQKLREVRTDRGATVAEARVAQRKAAQLTERFGLTEPPPSRARAAPRPPPPQAPRTGPGPRTFVWVGELPEDWWFDQRTGKGSDNVTVHSYRDRANWKIEVKL